MSSEEYDLRLQVQIHYKSGIKCLKKLMKKSGLCRRTIFRIIKRINSEEGIERRLGSERNSKYYSINRRRLSYARETTSLKLSFGSINAQKYIETLEECLLEDISILYPDGYILQQDNARPHTALKTKVVPRQRYNGS